MTGGRLHQTRRPEGDTEWMDRAACRGADTQLFYPSRGEDLKPAKRICNGDPDTGRPPCPVRDACLDYALRNGEAWGIWGGKSELERKRLRRARRKAA